MPRPQTLPALSGLRGLAALLVFVSHSANQGLLPDVLGRGFGQLGVMLFFLLSGFLMGYLYLDRPASRRGIYRFAQARVARVVPLYFACIAASVLISNGIDPAFHYDFRELKLAARAMLFIDAPFEFWTIPVEFQFYAVFVVFWWLWQRGTHGAWLLLFAFSFTALAIAQATLTPFEARLFPRYAPAFFVGVATALSLPWWRGQAERRWLKSSSWVALPLFLVNLPGLRQDLGLTFSDDFFWRTWGDPVNWVVVYAVFLCAVLDTRSVDFLNRRLFSYLGGISFALYLFHYPIIKYSKQLPIHAVGQLIVALGVTVLLAHLSFRYLETPASNWLKQRARSRGVPAVGAAT